MRDIVYCERLSTFNKNVDEGKLNAILRQKLLEKGVGVTPSQDSAFSQSLGYISNAFGEGKIDQDLYCAIEYVIFSSNKKRIDFMLSGYDDKNRENLIIIELKQWSNGNVSLLDYSENLGDNSLEALVSQNCYRETTHPSQQALGYERLFQNFYSVVQDHPIYIHSCSCLHNYVDEPNNPLKDHRFDDLLQESPTFLKTDNSKLREFVKTYLKKPGGKEIFECLDGSEIRPTQQLVENVNSLIVQNDRLSLFDSQQVVFNAIMAKVAECIKTKTKATFIINGGPGTGKSVVALKLLGAIYTKKLGKAFYLAQNSCVRYAFSEAIKKGGESRGVEQLLEYSGKWVQSVTQKKANEIECVLVDEAHRLTTSTQGAMPGKTIMNEIIHSALVSVFFIDEGQFVSYKDVGTVQSIKDAALANGSEIIQKPEFILDTQFRCNGSDGFIAFVDYAIHGKKPESSYLKFNYDVKFFQSGKDLYSAILEKKLSGNNSRLVAGYCYEWDKSDPNKRVVIPLDMPWNKDTKTWATRENSFDECGCVFSAQGIEFDYIGVVIGKDLIYDRYTDRAVVDVNGHAKSDHTYMNTKFKPTKENLAKAETYIKNAYKILLTRGLKGCYIYCEDAALNDYLQKLWEKFIKDYADA